MGSGPGVLQSWFTTLQVHEAWLPGLGCAQAVPASGGAALSLGS